MSTSARIGSFCASAVLLAFAASPALASTTTTTTSTTSSAASTTTTTTTSTTATPVAAGGQSPGKLTLGLVNVGGTPPFALLGGEMTVHGVVTPYVAGQTVQVGFYLGNVRVSLQTVSVLPAAPGTGAFRSSYSSRVGGLVQARVVHAASEQQAAFSGRSPGVRFVSDSVGPGASGQSVRLLQEELYALHYAVPLNGSFDEATGRALIAYRKMVGLERVALAGRTVFEHLKAGAGAFHVRFPQDGRHVEGDLTRQVLAEIEPDGRVYRLYTMSSGKPSTPTVLGHFNVYEKTFGENSDGMVDSNYFIRGYAIHGYHEVPTYAASHGCLRVPIPDAAAIYSWVRVGTPVDVYYEHASEDP
jgi:hypothetical protein